jgi:RND family efflux transporter MFP subunit
VQKLYQENVVPKADFDTADSALRVATASVDELEQELVKARAGARPEDIAAAKANIRGLETALKVARDQLADTELRAPFAGVVVSQFIGNHEMVTPGMPVLAMQDISELEIKVNVPETELVRQTNWQEFVAIASFATVPDRSFPVTLKEFSTEADSSTRTYAVTFSLPQPDDINLLPGMTAEVRRQLRDGVAPTDTTVAVPAKAVLTDGNGLRYVWVLPAGTELAERRTVTCGALAGEDDIRILEGLTVGDPVIVAGANFITEHTPVRAMP